MNMQSRVPLQGTDQGMGEKDGMRQRRSQVVLSLQEGDMGC